MFIFDNNICAVYKRVISLFHRFNQKKKKFSRLGQARFLSAILFLVVRKQWQKNKF